MSKHLSRFGVYNYTTKGWCFVGDPGFRASLAVCEQELASFRREYPNSKYRIAKHSEDCDYSTLSTCCEPSL